MFLFFFFFHCSIMGKNRDFLMKIGPQKMFYFPEVPKKVLGKGKGGGEGGG